MANDNRTPADLAAIDIRAENKWLIIIQNAAVDQTKSTHETKPKK
jgi:hypothetical protein